MQALFTKRLVSRGRLVSALLLAVVGLACDGSWLGSDSVRVTVAVDSESPLDPSIPRSSTPVEMLDDPRLKHLLEVAKEWRNRPGPAREVVDQVCVVSDLPSFLAAVSTWDERRFFPVLLDDPAWSVPFVRAFRPARIVRLRAVASAGDREPGAFEVWSRALEAVGRAWGRDEPGGRAPLAGGAFPRSLGPTSPGVVLSSPQSPTLAAAVALAAGRFQPLVHLEPMTVDKAPLGFDDAPSEAQAVEFAREIEARIAPLTTSYNQGLGDDVDFLTLAGDWPYRYRAETGKGIMSGERAVDDLIGRVLPADSHDLERALVRWAYVGRIPGDAAAGVYRAMCALFLQPESALLWNTYGGGVPWSDYEVTGAAKLLGSIRPAADAVVARSGAVADLTAWRELLLPRSRFDLLMLNSSGGPDYFSIKGGPGRPADAPFGAPMVVSMIHSFSAARPNDPSTIAGRFLDHGAYIYFGSMNEPYLTAFRTPFLVAQLIAAGTPLSASLRQGPYEQFGQPWRLVYLGDPLYRVLPTFPAQRVTRLTGAEWDRIAAGQIVPPPDVVRVGAPPKGDDAAEALDWCREAALPALGSSAEARPIAEALPGVLLAIDRGRLDPARRAVLDDLLIDQAINSDEPRAFLERLLKIPPEDRSPRVWRTIETLAEEQRQLGEAGAVEPLKAPTALRERVAVP